MLDSKNFNVLIFTVMTNAGEKADGLVHITNEETQVSKFYISMILKSERLPKKSFFGKVMKAISYTSLYAIHTPKCLLNSYVDI